MHFTPRMGKTILLLFICISFMTTLAIGDPVVVEGTTLGPHFERTTENGERNQYLYFTSFYATLELIF